MSAGQTAAVRFLPTLRDFGKNFIMRDTDKVPISEAIVLAPAATGLHIAHLAIEESRASRGMLNEQPHSLFTSTERVFR